MTVKGQLAPLPPMLRKFRKVCHDLLGSFVDNLTYSWIQSVTLKDFKWSLVSSSCNMLLSAFLMPCFWAASVKAVGMVSFTKHWSSCSQYNKAKPKIFPSSHPQNCSFSASKQCLATAAAHFIFKRGPIDQWSSSPIVSHVFLCPLVWIVCDWSCWFDPGSSGEDGGVSWIVVGKQLLFASWSIPRPLTKSLIAAYATEKSTLSSSVELE